MGGGRKPSLRDIWLLKYLANNCRTQVLGLGLGVDFVFSPPQQQVTNLNPHQNLPEGSVQQTLYLALRINSQNEDQVTTVMDGHPSS